MNAWRSGEVESNRWDNISKLRPGDEVKIVVADRADFEWALDVIERHQLQGRVPVLLSPVHEKLEAVHLASWILDSGLEARLNTQLHKQLWGDEPGR